MRACVLGLIVATSVLVVGCSQALPPQAERASTTTTTAAPTTTTVAADHAHHHDHSGPASASPEEQAAARRLVVATRAATARYADLSVALAAGYRPNRDEGPKPTHYPKPGMMRDGRVLDPNAPESLMYWNAPDGRKVLVAAVFKAGGWEIAPVPGGDLTVWHTHIGERMCHPAQDATCPQHTQKMLHVFVFDGAQNPFAETIVGAAGSRAAAAVALRAALVELGN